ncbi:hypothetical protein BDV28DRAFT_144489 [Aspergillus coremiiformis]|uniref:Uncharacterized protein n=1 Tax=Aspergillus coremiiformis TaxID=138285 RepID=A0A5N6YRG7_9EURO|nr:hypothetical protein BDV28DRAFT_144489 [Aspergillus coremiiformis]
MNRSKTCTKYLIESLCRRSSSSPVENSHGPERDVFCIGRVETGSIKPDLTSEDV